MEDPVRFDIWCSVLAGHINEAFSFIINLNQSQSALEVRKLVNYSVRTNNLILIQKSLTWREAEYFRGSPPGWVKDVEIREDDLNPDDHSNQYCEIHELYYGSRLGCPVCRGFYVED